MKTGNWVVKENGGEKSYPARIAFVLDELVTVDVMDTCSDKMIRIHGRLQEFRPATKEDFDRFILDASNTMIEIEKAISNAYELQMEVL
jgi:hypothetical protein